MIYIMVEAVFFVGARFFCFLTLFFLLQKLFTIAEVTITSAPQKAHNLLVYSVLWCLFSVSVINNWRLINSYFCSVSLYFIFYFCSAILYTVLAVYDIAKILRDCTKVLGGSVDRPLTIMTERIYDAEDFYLLPSGVLEAVCNSSYDIVRVYEYETHYSFRTASGWVADVFQKIANSDVDLLAARKKPRKPSCLS